MDWWRLQSTRYWLETFLENLFLETFDLSNSDQLVNFTARKKHTLGLLITNSPSFVDKNWPITGFGDHDAEILVQVACQTKYSKPPHQEDFICKKADFKCFKSCWKHPLQKKLDRKYTLSILRLYFGYTWSPIEVCFKGYLHCKMITSQNVSFDARVKNFVIFQKSYIPFLRYSRFCIFDHSMIYQICDVMMSISTWDKVHFWIYFLNHNSISHQTWPIDK